MEKLTFRHELKYYINESDYAVLSTGLAHMLKRDRNAGKNGEYTIRSLYFDDFEETALVEKMAGVQSRAKYRIRIYDYSDRVIKFEKKIKEGQYIAKKSLSLTRSECDRIIAGDPYPLLAKNSPYAREIFLQMKLFQLKPVVVVDYEREAFVMDYESVRITFDKNLRSGSPLGSIFDRNMPTVPVCPPGMMVLEVKFNKSLPGYIRNFLANMACNQRTAISKYVSCRKYER